MSTPGYAMATTDCCGANAAPALDPEPAESELLAPPCGTTCVATTNTSAAVASAPSPPPSSAAIERRRGAPRVRALISLTRRGSSVDVVTAK